MLLVFALLLFTSISFAETNEVFSAALDAESSTGISHCIILAVLAKENGTPGEDTYHLNGNVDTGIAQIRRNGEWMRYFAEMGITYEMLRDNPSVATLATGHILFIELQRTGDIVQAVSAYYRGFGRSDSIEGYRYAKSVFKKIESSRCMNDDDALKRKPVVSEFGLSTKAISVSIK